MTDDLNTTAPRDGEAFTQTLKRRKSAALSKVARIAAQAEKDRTRRELETLARVRDLAGKWVRGVITDQEAATLIWELVDARREGAGDGTKRG